MRGVRQTRGTATSWWARRSLSTARRPPGESLARRLGRPLCRCPADAAAAAVTALALQPLGETAPFFGLCCVSACSEDGEATMWDSQAVNDSFVAVQIATLIFVAEWGDRSMLATIALAVSQSPLGAPLPCLQSSVHSWSFS